jgi:Fe-S-cluster containining protein
MVFNCETAFKLGLCKGDCCGCVPIKKEVIKRNEHKQQRKVTNVAEATPTEIIPITEDMKCVFLNDKYGCEIYEERPWVCREFGMGREKDELMLCPYLKPSGRIRSEANRKKIERICGRKIKYIFSK